MEFIQTILLALLLLIAVPLVVLILVQQGKGADMGAAFGSGAANTLFGSSGAAGFLTKLTAWFAVAFFVVAFALAHFARQQSLSLGELGIPEAVPQEEVSEAQSDLVEAEDVQQELSDVPALEINASDDNYESETTTEK